jgi:hypothetical protein
MNVSSYFTIPALGRHVTISRAFLIYLGNTRGKHSSSELQKTAILGRDQILRKTWRLIEDQKLLRDEHWRQGVTMAYGRIPVIWRENVMMIKGAVQKLTNCLRGLYGRNTGGKLHDQLVM